MKICFTDKFKYFLIIALVLIVAGMTLYGIFGINYTGDFKNSYEIQVGIDQNLNGSGDIVKDAAEKYFSEKGIKISSYATQTVDDGATYIYKTQSLDNLVEADLKKAVDDAIAASSFNGYIGAVKVYQTDVIADYNLVNVLIAFGAALVLVFIYALCVEKLAAGVAVLVVSLLSGVLYVSVTALLRVPSTGYFPIFAFASMIFGGTLSIVMVNRFREIGKTAEAEKFSNKEIAEKGASASVVRFLFVFAAVTVACVASACVGSLYLAIISLGLFVSVVVAIFSALCFTPSIYVGVKGKKK